MPSAKPRLPAVRHAAAETGPALNVLGCRLTAKSHCRDRGDPVFVCECVVPAGVAVPLHTHPQWETFYLLEGMIEFGRMGEDGELGTVLARTGDLVSIDGSAAHSFRNPGPASARLLVVGESGLESFYFAAGQDAPPGLPSEDEIDRVVRIMLAHGQHVLGPHPRS
jgi:quercetin dioxygenase-like cupin family protein